MAVGAEVETHPWRRLEMIKKLIGVPQVFVFFCFFKILNSFLLPMDLEKQIIACLAAVCGETHGELSKTNV